jgi:hypothetical protein
VVLVAVCEPIYANQAVRTTLLAIMPTLDDVDIASVQRGDQSRGVVIPGLGGPGGAHGHGGVPSAGGPTGSRNGALAGDRGGGLAPAPSKGKHARVVLNDDEVSSDEDEPLQKWLRQLSSAGTAALDEAVAADKEVAEEATTKRAAEEAAVKAAADEEVAGKTVDEAAGAVGDSLTPGQAPLVAGAKGAATPSGSTPPVKRPYRGVWKPWFV